MSDTDKLFREIFSLLLDNECKLGAYEISADDFEQRFAFFKKSTEFFKLREWTFVSF